MALKQVIDVGGQGESPMSRDIAGSGSAYAKDTNFDPTNTDFESTQLQALGEEIDGALGTKASKENLSDYILTGTKPSTALSSGTFFVDKDGALRVATADISTTDDVGSGNSEVKSVGEVLSELNSNLAANKRSSVIDLSSAIDAINRITFISDGYLYIDLTNVNTGDIMVKIEDSVGSSLGGCKVSAGYYQSIFVKKGMKTYCTGIPNGAIYQLLTLTN